MRISCAATALFLLGASAAFAAEPARRTVEIRVEVTEVDNKKAANYGVEWLSDVGWDEKRIAGPVSIGSIERLTGLKADLHFLVEKGAAELLANPNLVTEDGASASFRAGGEIPYITSASLGSTHVEFKPYGVGLKVKPDVLESGQIRMDLEATVSAPDPTEGASLSGNVVPALLEREVQSRVTVAPDTTLTLAGLVQDRRENTESGVPILGRIPLVGGLFRWKRTNDRRTSIIIFVTPRVLDL